MDRKALIRRVASKAMDRMRALAKIGDPDAFERLRELKRRRGEASRLDVDYDVFLPRSEPGDEEQFEEDKHDRFLVRGNVLSLRPLGSIIIQSVRKREVSEYPWTPYGRRQGPGINYEVDAVLEFSAPVRLDHCSDAWEDVRRLFDIPPADVAEMLYYGFQAHMEKAVGGENKAGFLNAYNDIFEP